jgi:hypothetical protein
MPTAPFKFTVATGGQTVQKDEGTFTAAEATLRLSPTTGPERSFQRIVDKQRAVDDTRLVLGGSDIYTGHRTNAADIAGLRTASDY